MIRAVDLGVYSGHFQSFPSGIYEQSSEKGWGTANPRQSDRDARMDSELMTGGPLVLA
ncbi:antigen like protein [Clarias magur]|uniref:Antigen like protein n=1 Tax=Clarias magur TaxID=1594786 RepID=A0A8J4WRY4_CLAMG|nr:antigen like protein [Clarias magur]